MRQYSLVGVVVSLLVMLGLPGMARAEGENWVPLYNKLARMLNERTVLLGLQGTATPPQTQGEYDAAFIQNNNTLSVDAGVSQANLNVLRQTIVVYASTYFSGPDHAGLLIRYTCDSNGDPEWDAWGNQQTTGDFFKTGHGFIIIPGEYGALIVGGSDTGSTPTRPGGVPTPVAFTSAPVLWEHFQEIYEAIDKLRYLPNQYGSARYSEEGVFKSQDAIATAVKLINSHREVFGVGGSGSDTLNEQLADIVTNGDMDPGETIQAAHINLMRRIVEALVGVVYVRDPNGPNGWRGTKGYDKTKPLWIQPGHACPITFNHIQVRDDFLRPGISRDNDGDWSHDNGDSIAPSNCPGSNTGNRGGGWGQSLPSNAWVLPVHLEEITDFIGQMRNNELWVKKNGAGGLAPEIWYHNSYSKWESGITTSYSCDEFEIDFDNYGSREEIENPFWTEADYVVAHFLLDVGFRTAQHGSPTPHSANRFVFMSFGGDRSVELTLPDDSNPHGGNILHENKVAANPDDGNAIDGMKWGDSKVFSVDTEDLLDFAFQECPGFIVGDCDNPPDPVEKWFGAKNSDGVSFAYYVLASIFECDPFDAEYIMSMEIEFFVPTTYYGVPESNGSPFSYSPSGGSSGFELSQWRDLAPSSITTTDFKPLVDAKEQGLCVTCMACSSGACSLEASGSDQTRGWPHFKLELGRSNSPSGTDVVAYLSEGMLKLPVTGLSASAGSEEEASTQAFSLDAATIGAYDLTDPATGNIHRYVNLRRPTGRIVTIRFDYNSGTSSFNLDRGVPVGVDQHNSEAYFLRSASGAYELVFPDRQSPEHTVIHRYPTSGGRLDGVAYGESMADGAATEATGPTSWPGLTYYPPFRDAASTPPYHLNLFDRYVELTFTNGRVTGVVQRSKDSPYDELVSTAISRGGDGRATGAVRSVKVAGVWQESSRLTLPMTSTQVRHPTYDALGRLVREVYQDTTTGQNISRRDYAYIDDTFTVSSVTPHSWKEGTWVVDAEAMFDDAVPSIVHENSSQEALTQASRTVSVDPATGHRVVRELRRLTEEGGGDDIDRVTTTLYRTFPWGEEVISAMPYDLGAPGSVGYPLPAPEGYGPTLYLYYDDKDNDGDNFGRLKQVIQPTGQWSRYTYDARGRVTKVVSQFLDEEPDADEVDSRVVTYTYDASAVSGSGDDGSLSSDVARRVVTKLLDEEVARSYTVVLANETRQIACVTTSGSGGGAAWDASDNLVTITTTYDSGTFKGRTKSVLNPDGTMTLYTYAESSGEITTTVDSGEPNNYFNAIVDGTRSISVVEDRGRSVSRKTVDIASGVTLSESVNTTFDALGRVTRVDNVLDGTFTLTSYGCCHADQTTDRDGIVTTYEYDSLGRLLSTSRLGITTAYQYDVDGNQVQVTRIGTDTSEIILSASVYDAAGRLVSTTDALENTTHYHQAFDSQTGRLVRTTILPDETPGTLDDNPRTIETYHHDGSLLSTDGDAVHPTKYIYGVENDGGSLTRPFTKVILLQPSETGHEEDRWSKSYTDMLGRTYKTVLAGGATSSVHFNIKGQAIKQVDPDGIVTLTSYLPNGDVQYTAIDLDQDDTIDLAGMDAITQTINDVLDDSHIDNTRGVPIRRSRSYLWATDNTDSALLVSTTETALSGFTGDVIAHTWTTSFGLTSEQKIELDASTQTRTITAIKPDGGKTVTVIVNGRTQSVTTYDATPTQLSQITYTYDPHGRLASTEDAYSSSGGGGETEYTYDDADRVVAVTTPDPVPGGGNTGVGLDPQTTEYEFDAQGRQVKITHPDAGETHFTYHPTGQLKKTWGTRAYPIEYTYNDQGQLATMTTWKDHDTPSGAAVTTWNYSLNRGLITSKQYNDGKGPSYTYTPAGRLLTRTWARLDGVSPLLTTYDYDNAGRLIEIDYSDTTPDVTHTYNRRGLLTQTIDGAGTRVYTYNTAGQVLTEGYTAGIMEDLGITNVYDGQLRRQSLTASRDTTNYLSVGYTYDAAGRLATIGSPAIGITSNTVGGIATYTYTSNAPGMVASVTFNNGIPGTPDDDVMVTTRTYDLLGRLQQIKSNHAVTTANVYSSHAYQLNDANQRTKATLGDSHSGGGYWNYQYDSLGQLTSGKRYWPNDTPVAGQQFTYAYDDIGNRISSSGGGDDAGANLRSTTYTSNLLNQMTERTVPGYIDVMGYLKPALNGATVEVNTQAAYQIGNYYRKELTVNNSSSLAMDNIQIDADLSSTIYGELRYMGAEARETPEIYTYDDDGNLLTDGRWEYTWDAENRLIKMETRTDVGIVRFRYEFAYDSLGRRVQKEWWIDMVIPNLESRMRFIYDGWNLVAEVNASSGSSTGLVRGYAWGADLSGSEQGAGGVGGLIFILKPTLTPGVHESYIPTYDGNGNVTTLVRLDDGGSSAGEVAARYEYDPYGRELTGPPLFLPASEIAEGMDIAIQNPFRFSTKYRDNETGLLYFGHRYYSPQTGNWVSRDPIQEQGGSNVYGYVGNRPAGRADPLGMAAVFFDGTGNDENQTDHGVSAITNVLKLYNVSNDPNAIYMAGVGSEYRASKSYVETKALGGLSGHGIGNILDEAWEELAKRVNSTQDETVDIIGFSRGAATALAFANMVHERAGTSPGLRSGISGDTIRQMAGSRKEGWTLLCRNVQIRFVGLFDTVASIGIPGNSVNIGMKLSLPPGVKKAVHAMALDEYRSAFPITRVPGAREVWFSGVHSNIGGGYEDSGLSDIPLMWMYYHAVDAGMNIGIPNASPNPLGTMRSPHVDSIIMAASVGFSGGMHYRKVYASDQIHETVIMRMASDMNYRKEMTNARGRNEVTVDPLSKTRNRDQWR